MPVGCDVDDTAKIWKKSEDAACYHYNNESINRDSCDKVANERRISWGEFAATRRALQL